MDLCGIVLFWSGEVGFSGCPGDLKCGYNELAVYNIE